jgi:hypothetical protein
MPGRRSGSQRGAALLAMVAIVALGAAWSLASRLNEASAELAAARRAHNAQVLMKAKEALVGHVMLRALAAGEDNPGKLPCPEAAGFVGNPSNEGTAAGNCSLPKIGRLPWRTLGLDKLVDAHAEPLWYVVSPGWALPNSTATLTINSDSVGQLTVNGQANAAVALIIAPGPAIQVQASPGCAERTQTRSPPSPTINPLNYLECYNLAAGAFATVGPASSFNDQVITITAADVLPAIEAAIAQRIEREIAPALKAVYADADATWGLSSAQPVFAFPAPFANPASSSFQGDPSSCAMGRCEGLLPVNRIADCDAKTQPCVAWAAPLEASAALLSGIAEWISAPSCGFIIGSTVVRCSGRYTALLPVQVGMGVRASNVTRGLRALDAGGINATYQLAGWNPVPAPASGTIHSDGSATITATASFPAGSAIDFRIEMNIAMVVDHPLLDESTASSTGWFLRNRWHRVAYYAVAQGNTAAGVPAPLCIPTVNCLAVENLEPAGRQRALLILAGRPLGGAARPSGELSSYLELGNASGSFERRAVGRAFNDRIVVVDATP